MKPRDTTPEAVARRWLARQWPAIPWHLAPGALAVRDVARLIRATEWRVRQKHEQVICRHRMALLLARGRAQRAGRASAASHRQSDIETCDQLLDAIRALNRKPRSR